MRDASPTNPGENPPADERDVSLAYHELAHCFAAFMFNHRVHVVSIVPGQHWGGMTIHTAMRATVPISEQERRRAVNAWTPVMWPVRFRRMLEVGAIISLAGPSVDDIIWPLETGYVSEDLGTELEEVAQRVSAPLSKRTVDLLAAADQPKPRGNDVDRAIADAQLLSPSAPFEMYRWLRAEAASLVQSSRFGKAFDIALPVLLERRTMTGAAIRRLTEEEGGIRW
jgi:hypothetical protein